MISKETEAEIVRLYPGRSGRSHDRDAARCASHDGAARASPDRRRTEGRGSAAVDGGPVRAVHRRAAREVPNASSPSRLFAMVKERGYAGGADHFRRVVGRHRPRKPAEAFPAAAHVARRTSAGRLGALRQAQDGPSRTTALGLRDGAELLAAALFALLPGRVDAVLLARSRRCVRGSRRRRPRPSL